MTCIGSQPAHPGRVNRRRRLGAAYSRWSECEGVQGAGRPCLLAGSRHGTVEWTRGVGRGLDPRTDDWSARSPAADLPAPVRPRSGRAGQRSRCHPRRHRQRRAGPAHASRFTTPSPESSGRRTEGDRSGTPGPLAGAVGTSGGGPGVPVVVATRSDRDRLRRLGAPPGRVVAFADDLVSRGRMLPTVLAEGPAAVWRPLLSGPDAAWARVLAAALPPALLATADDHEVGADGVSQVEARDPLAVWAAAFDDLVDASVRAALGPARLSLGRRGTPTSRAWLAALTGATRTFHATRADLDGLTTALARWQSDALAGPVRAFFRLTEPTVDTDGDDHAASDAGAGGEHWWLRFGLQATDEQGLVAEAGEVWRATGALPGLGRVVNARPGDLPGRAGQGGPPLPGAGRRAPDRPPGRPRASTWRRRTASSARPPPPSPPPGSGSSCRAGGSSRPPGWASRLPATRPRPAGMSSPVPGRPRRPLVDYEWEVSLGEERLDAEELPGWPSCSSRWSGCAGSGSSSIRAGSPAA